MSKRTTINICPRWIDIIDIMLYSWEKGGLEGDAKESVRKEFHKLARCADEKMKELKQGPYAKGGQYYEEEE
tara:strand:- start:312 stop:527 length:216 start_codon:yes stop_codon:yes gene_type:complete